jgi:hypothetical protein
VSLFDEMLQNCLYLIYAYFLTDLFKFFFYTGFGNEGRHSLLADQDEGTVNKNSDRYREITSNFAASLYLSTFLIILSAIT